MILGFVHIDDKPYEGIILDEQYFSGQITEGNVYHLSPEGPKHSKLKDVSFTPENINTNLVDQSIVEYLYSHFNLYEHRNEFCFTDPAILGMIRVEQSKNSNKMKQVSRPPLGSPPDWLVSELRAYSTKSTDSSAKISEGIKI